MVTERRGQARPQLPIDEEEAAIAHRRKEEPLAGSRMRTGLANVDTRRQSAVVATSRRSLIEDDEGRRHSRLM
jgi:hypothetical protein